MDQYNNMTDLKDVGHDDNKATTDKSELPPAIRIKLTGQYLIEASAGTGKTWTLTGIVLRLLIEGKRAPEHIIATTFTRAAAAEMRERIHDRLVSFYQLLQWVNKLPVDPISRDVLYPQLTNKSVKKSSDDKNISDKEAIQSHKANKKISLEQQKKRQEWLKNQAKLSGIDDLIDDPINSYLLEYLLDNTEDYPLAEALRRCALVLTTLDKLFVGTLDSLSQKWLSEYSAETGHQQGIQISDQEQLVIESIIHDVVRAHHSALYNQQPHIYQLLQHTKRLTSPADHNNVANKSLQFISTPIEHVEMGEPIDFTAYQQALDDFANSDLKDVEPYFDLEYRTAQGFGKAGKIGKNIDSINMIQQAIKQYGIAFFAQLDGQADVLYTELPAALISKEDGGKVFNKGKEAERLAFINKESIQALQTLRNYTDRIALYLDALVENLNREIAIKVRQKLPSILEARRETTFALQMVRLNQALSGRQGERLARYIRHHYPVALIDESQDINGEQARMIERIYLSKNSDSSGKDDTQQKTGRGFLLLVGDPKQAIYGFRGGDVANYNAMKVKFNKSNIMSLDINRRSNVRLITALNHWFGRPNPIDDTVEDSASRLAQLGKGIYYQHITAANADSRLSWQSEVEQPSKAPLEAYSILSNSPVSVIHLPYDKQAKYDACEMTALHIAALLASGQTIDGRAIKPNDIGVLARRKQELKQVENMLSKLGVPTLETAEKNVFDTPIAADLAALLEAMLRPQRQDIINRLLTSNFYQLSLTDVQALMLDEDSADTPAALKKRYQNFQYYLKTAASYWQHNGILSALHYLLARNPMLDRNNQQTQNQSIWVALANLEEGARYLMDLRQLLDILAQHGMHIGEHKLLAWYKKNMHSNRTPEWAQQQPLPTESGAQLMTIHKSKGLEFPIVYVVGMDSASPKGGGRSKHNLFLYDHDTDDNKTDNSKTERRLSASKGKPHSKSTKGDTPIDYYAQFETTENYEEFRRLAYVAFTRASEQLYMVLKDGHNKTDAERKPSLQWLNCEDHKFALPERLQPYISWLEYAAIESSAETIIDSSDISNSKKTASMESGVIADSALRIDYQSAYAQLQQSSFKGWAKTSFTALSRQLSEQSKALAIFDDNVEDDLDLTDSLSQFSVDDDNQYSHEIGSDNIRFRFVKGANAGTFLHEVFEKIDFNNQSKWSTIIDQGIRQYQLPVSYTSAAHQQRLAQNQAAKSDNQAESSDDADTAAQDLALAAAHNELIAWISDILAAPLLASGQALQSIAVEKRIAELSFNMGLAAEFLPEHINEVFAQHLPDEPEKHIALDSQYSSYIYRYLRGEIDLVYEHAGKYHVLDYKSNYLGDSLSNYNNENLGAAMNKAGYWLQAAIYQVALHRFLRMRIPNYQGNETNYLGAVEYVFLRGIDSQGVHNYGRIKWDIPFTLIRALDEMFGTPNR